MQAPDEDRYQNLAAVAVLTGPTWTEPEMVQFSADLPRPPAAVFYDLDIPGSDAEFDIAGNGASEASAGGSEASHGSLDDGAQGMEVSEGGKHGRVDIRCGNWPAL